jgi:hypothetical protein
MNIQQNIVLPSMLTWNVLLKWIFVRYIVFYEHERWHVRSSNMMIFNLCRMFMNLPLGANSSPWDWDNIHNYN